MAEMVAARRGRMAGVNCRDAVGFSPERGRVPSFDAYAVVSRHTSRQNGRMRPGLSLAAVLTLAVSGCGSGDGGGEPTTTPPAPRTTTHTQAERPARPHRKRPRAPRCDPAAANCAAASGRIIALESKDPDGDGDLHVILAGGSVTARGLTVLDISRSLRPRHDPHIGDWAAGAGPVYTGSLGQHQIEVDRVVFFPRR